MTSVVPLGSGERARTMAQTLARSLESHASASQALAHDFAALQSELAVAWRSDPAELHDPSKRSASGSDEMKVANLSPLSPVLLSPVLPHPPSVSAEGPVRLLAWGNSVSKSGICEDPDVKTISGNLKLETSPVMSNRQGVAAMFRGKTFNKDQWKKNDVGSVFADAETLKDRIRAHLTEDRFDIQSCYYETGFAQACARSGKFECVCLIMVVLSCCWISVEIELDDSEQLLNASPIFLVMSNIFTSFFFFELVVRVVAFKNKFDVLRDRSLLFDALLVFLMMVDTWVMLLVSLMLPKGVDVSYLMFMRILRLLRTLRITRVMRSVPELLVIIRGIMLSVRAILVIAMLLFFIIYFFAIIFRVALGGTAVGAKRFGSVDAAMGTLLLDCTLSGAKGVSIVRECYNETGFIPAIILLFYVGFAAITVMGVLSGLLVQSVKTISEVEREEREIKGINTKMDQIWLEILASSDAEECISPAAFAEFLEKKEECALLQQIGVDAMALANMSAFVFEQHGGKLKKPEFKRLMLDARGKQASRVQDHVLTRKFLRGELMTLAATIANRDGPDKISEFKAPAQKAEAPAQCS